MPSLNTHTCTHTCVFLCVKHNYMYTIKNIILHWTYTTNRRHFRYP